MPKLRLKLMTATKNRKIEKTNEKCQLTNGKSSEAPQVAAALTLSLRQASTRQTGDRVADNRLPPPASALDENRAKAFR